MFYYPTESATICNEQVIALDASKCDIYNAALPIDYADDGTRM